MRTSQAINGFIASEPRLTHSESGKARLYARIGMEHFERQEDGSYEKLDPTFHDLVMFGKAAERSADRFKKGDRFLAQGYVRDSVRQLEDGQQIDTEQFIASRIGHDMNVTNYEVQRRTAAERAEIAQALEARAQEIKQEPTQTGPETEAPFREPVSR